MPRNDAPRPRVLHDKRARPFAVFELKLRYRLPVVFAVATPNRRSDGPWIFVRFPDGP